MIHYKDRCIDMNKRCIAIDTAELSRTRTLMQAATSEGMLEYYRANARNIIMHLRISRDSIARWEAI